MSTLPLLKKLILTIFVLIFLSYKVIYALDKWEISIEGAPSGKFDFNAYSVTWQPSFCEIYQKQDLGCDNTFKVHGVWPYYEAKNIDTPTNYHPSDCYN